MEHLGWFNLLGVVYPTLVMSAVCTWIWWALFLSMGTRGQTILLGLVAFMTFRMTVQMFREGAWIMLLLEGVWLVAMFVIARRYRDRIRLGWLTG